MEARAASHAAVVDLLTDRAWTTVIRELRISAREAEIIHCILAFNDSEGSIAECLGISPHTVHTHLERLYRKLHVVNRCQMVSRLFVAYVTSGVVSRAADASPADSYLPHPSR